MMHNHTRSTSLPMPASAGIGLREPHHQHILTTRPSISWLEVHSENYFSFGSQSYKILEQLRTDYPISLHGVGLSLGSASPLDMQHLTTLKELIRRIEPRLVSEHVAWSHAGNTHLPDLLPVPYTEEALDTICENIEKTQDYLGRQILVENPSSYLSFNCSTLPEWEFMRETATRTGCAILLDINNIYVSAHNHNFDAQRYIDAIPSSMVQEMHLAGHAVNQISDSRTLLIDHHGDYTCDAVWKLYQYAIRKHGRTPTLIEWDTDIPDFSVLEQEAAKAEAIMKEFCDDSRPAAA